MYISGYSNMKLMKAEDYNFILHDLNCHHIDIETNSIQYDFLNEDGTIKRIKGKLSPLVEMIPDLINQYLKGNLHTNTEDDNFSLLVYKDGMNKNLARIGKDIKRVSDETSDNLEYLEGYDYGNEDYDNEDTINETERIENNLYFDYGWKKLKEINRKYIIEYQVNLITLIKAALRGVPNMLQEFQELLNKPGSEELKELLMDLGDENFSKLINSI